MRILVTGAKGFVGKNLCSELKNRGYTDILEFDLETDPALLDEWVKDCDFVYHLAGVNRPKDPADFMKGNFGFTSVLLDKLKVAGNKAPVLISSSIHAAKVGNDYGESKKAGEDLIFQYGRDNDVTTYVFRLANLFGKWCRPNYNSVVATFSYNAAHDLPLPVNDPNAPVPFVYIDDVVENFIAALEEALPRDNEKGAFTNTDQSVFYTQDLVKDGPYYTVGPIHTVTVGRLASLLEGFRASRNDLQLPQLDDPFEKKLYSTYLSYLETDDFAYDLKMNVDDRGSFTEFIRTPDRGQVSINVAKPGIVKGNHWHHTKNEKFLVVSGEAVIRFRKLDEDQVIEYRVSGEKLQVVDIPVGYTHNIENVGQTDLVTVMWANEAFDPDHPDTFFLKV